MNRKIELAKQKRTQKAQEQALVDKQIQSQERLTKAVDGLYELLNGQEQYDFDKLHTQLVEIDKRLDLAPHFKSLEKSITTSHKPYDNKTKIEGFSELLRAVKTNKPIPSDIKLDKLEKAVVNIEQYIREQSEPEDKGAENYKPVRRVVKMGNRFFFDDNMTSGGGGGSGGNTDGLTDAQLRASPVPVTATIDTTGLATSTKQSDGSQKTQIVDSGGEAATVTGGKLDVNATASLAGTALPIAGASEGVGVAIVDGSGNQITSFGGGTQYTEDAAAAANPVGTALNMVRDDARSGSLTTADGDNVAARGNNKGELYVKATDTDALLTTIDADTGTIATEVAGLLTDTELRATPVPVSGTVTANAGTNLNTSALATEAGNLATIKTNTDKIPSQGQALAAASTPVVLTAAQVTTLTPPAAITGFATESTLSTLNGKVTAVNTGAVVVSSSALPSGAATSAKQDTQITAEQAIQTSVELIDDTVRAEDVASADGHKGVVQMAVRQDTPANTSNTDGDYEIPKMSGGRMWVDASGKTLTVDGSGVTQPVSAASLPLPSGAATAAKQPALGTAGTASADVITVQGRAAMTPLLTDGSATTQPVSNAGLTELASAINSDKLDINLKTSDIAFGGTSAADDADFTAGTTPGTPSMGVYESTPTSVTDGDLGTVGITAGRRLKTSATIDAALPAGTNNIGDVDVVSMPTTTVQATNLDIRDLTNADVVTAELSATDNAVLDAIAASTAAIDTDATTIIGHVDGIETAIGTTNTTLTTIDGRVDGIEGLIGTTNTNTGNAATSLAIVDDWDATAGSAHPADGVMAMGSDGTNARRLKTDTSGELQIDVLSIAAGDNNIGNVDIASIAAGDNNIGNVDVVTLPSLPAGTNGIGKLTANSGVDIGDVDVTSAVSATLDHGSNRDIDTSAEQITSTSFACKFGVTLKADIANTGILYIGNSDVTAGTTAATDGFPLSPGESLTLEVTNSNIPYAIASANNQVIYWAAV